MNGQIIEIKGADVRVAYHPSDGEPRIGEPLRLTPRGAGLPIIAQVIGYDSAGYPGDREVALGELLEARIAEKHEVVMGEPALVDLKEIKVARCKIRKIVDDGGWSAWDGTIPTRNVDIEPVSPEELVTQVISTSDTRPVTMCSFNGAPLQFDAAALDKVNALVGNKGTGKSHSAKLVLEALRALGAPCWVYDLNREFVGLPHADTIRVGENFQLSLHEVGFGFLMAVIDDMNPLQDVSRGALENVGPRLVREQLSRRGFATIDYLIDRAGQNAFHSNEKVNEAIETRLKMVRATNLFSSQAGTETLTDRFARIVGDGGFLVFDLALLPPGRLRALTRGLNRRLDAICESERAAGTNRYPFVFFEEAHFYTSPDEILNLITRGRHLGLTVFFITNTPGELPEVVFRQLDNLICTGLGHSADLRTISRSALSDEDTLQSLAVGLGQRDAMIVGRLTGGFPIVAQIGPLPDGYPATGATRSFWDGPSTPLAVAA